MMTKNNSVNRPRRLRRTAAIRDLVREHRVHVHDLIAPIFVKAGVQEPVAVDALPGQYQHSVESAVSYAQRLEGLGVRAVLLFGVPAHKDAVGSRAYHEEGIVQQTIRAIKAVLPELVVMVDVCCCEYTDHGHCGVWDAHAYDVDNDATLPLLAKQAVSFAEAGADVLAPSGMMDGMVAAMREALNSSGFEQVIILSYAVKYCSAMYEPFRDVAEGAPKRGDRQGYQMDVSNSAEALKEAALDVAEGADMLMVKPGHTYLDIVQRVKQAHPSYPLAVYHVSGEYAMLKAAVATGVMNEKRAVLELMTAFKRAGADMIITYYAEDVARWWHEDQS